MMMMTEQFVCGLTPAVCFKPIILKMLIHFDDVIGQSDDDGFFFLLYFRSLVQ